MIGAYIYSKLSADATVQSYVGTRIYPLNANQATDRPHITYQVLSNTPSDTKDGVSRLDEVLVQITVYDQSYDNAHACSTAVRNVLDRSSGTVGTLSVQSTQFTGQREMFDAASLISGTSIDFVFRINNPLNL